MLDQTPSPAYITLFGRFRYHRQEGDQRVALRLTKTDASILTVLLLTPGQTRPRDELATLLYGDANLNNLKQRLLGLEGRLGEQGMRLHWKHSQDVRFNMRGVTVDVFEFEDRAIRLGSSATYLADWETARQLRTGPLVQVLELRRDCLKQKRRSLDGKYQALLAKLAFAFRVLNRAEEVVSCLSERAECFPSENNHWRDLLATLVAYNRLEEAEAAYSRYREHRQGSTDTPEIGELRNRIFADGRTPPSAGRTLPGQTIPPAQSVTLTTRSLLTRPVGWEAELARLRNLVASGTRLITLTGPGGIGKTTLAHMAASDVSGAFENGAGAAYFGGVGSMETALAEFVRFQGVSLAPKEPIVNALARLHCLLILDNCEHLVDGVAEFVRSLAQTCPRVQIIATSRQAIGIPGEQICPLPPLSLPEDVARHPSPRR
jgi:DNA-binding SARP family transcriptional activator